MKQFFSDLDNFITGSYKIDIEKSKEYEISEGITWINNSFYRGFLYIIVVFLFILFFTIFLSLIEVLNIVYGIIIIGIFHLLPFLFLCSY